MKKFTLSAILAFSCAALFSQIPTPGFETWVNNNESTTTYLVPQQWITYDVVATAFNNLFGDNTYSIHTTSRVTGGHSGSYAAQMAVGVSNEGDTVGGAIFSVASAMDFINGAFNGTATGFHYTMRPANLTGYFKFNRLGGDSAIAQVIMTKWNTATQSRDTVVNQQNHYFTTSASSWTQFTVPLTYLQNEYPDTVLIALGISSSNPHIGTLFTVDDLAFSGSVPIGIAEQSSSNASVSISPNPFSDEAVLNISNVQLQNASFLVYDVAGNCVRVTEGISGSSTPISREGLAEGLYFYQLVNNNEVVASGKMIVK